MFENRVLKRVFGPKRDEVAGNGENYIMRSLVICTPHLILSRRMRWVGHVAGMGREEVRVTLWWGNMIERDQLEDPGGWEDNIKIDLQEVGYGGMDWMDLAQDRDRWRALVNAVMNLRVP